MCGIAGFNWQDPHLIRAMANRLAHRGPDAAGEFTAGSVSLGHRRLSILDLSQSANQPFSYGHHVIVFNGEIYNYKEIRVALQRKGHIFRTDSDTEVVLHAFVEYGENCVTRFNGMWSFCIYDQEKQTLSLSRDRFGEKPLYYFYDGRRFIFASEIKSILVHQDLELKIDRESVNHFFYQKYIGNGRTIYDRIHSLGPGTIAVLDLKACDLSLRSYFSIENEVETCLHIPVNRRLEQLEELILNSVAMRLVADVPVGTFLSGGLDSSLISAIAKGKKDDINTFSIGFSEPSYSEVRYSSAVSRKIGTNHFVETFDFRDEAVEEVYSKLDEPFGDSSILPTYLLSRLAKSKITVSLSGDAGDELFGGYDVYRGAVIKRYVPKALSSIGRSLNKTIPVSEKKVSSTFKAARFLRDLDMNASPIRQHLAWLSTYNDADRVRLLGDRFLPVDFATTLYPDNPLLSIQVNDIRHYLAECILRKVDFASMLASLEVRVPFLDHRLVPLALSLPDKYKMSVFNSKIALRRLARRHLPRIVVNRKKKGFSVPVSKWIRESHMAKEYLSSPVYFTHGYMGFEYVQELVARHEERDQDNGRQLWLAFVFNYWHYNRSAKAS